MLLALPCGTVVVREGRPEDIPLLLAFIREMAQFEKLEATATEASLYESMFGATATARFFLVFDRETPIAYITYFFTFSSMRGQRGLWLDDIFVASAYRGRGLGKALMGFLARFAKENSCGRFEWIVLNWNHAAIRLYQKLGAEILEDWKLCRVEAETFDAMVLAAEEA